MLATPLAYIIKSYSFKYIIRPNLNKAKILNILYKLDRGLKILKVGALKGKQFFTLIKYLTSVRKNV